MNECVCNNDCFVVVTGSVERRKCSKQLACQANRRGTTTTAVTGLQWCLSVQFQVASRRKETRFLRLVSGDGPRAQTISRVQIPLLAITVQRTAHRRLERCGVQPHTNLDAPGSSRQVSLVCNQVLCVLPENTTSRRNQATQNNKTEIKRLGCHDIEKLKRVRRCQARPAPCHKRYR